ncbi:MAG: ABC transporter ATP-binding protein [Acidiferrobacteraceae bacterium]
MAFMETVGVASIAPFMAIVSNPNVIHSNHVLAGIYQLLGAPGERRFLFLVGIAVLLILALSNVISAITTFFMYRFVYMQEHTLSTRLFESYLQRPYAFFLERNTADLTKNMLSEVYRMAAGVLVPMTNVIARSTMVLFVVALLLVVNPILATVVAVTLGGAYGLIYYGVHRRMGRMGAEQSVLSGRRYKIANEALAGIKDIKVLGRESAFLDQYARYSRDYSHRLATSQTIAQVPRYALETVAFGGIVLIVLYLLGTQHDVSQVLPLIALYAFAGYRLMPALQQIFSGLALIKFHMAAVDTIEVDLDVLGCHGSSKATIPYAKIFPCTRSIEFKDVSFSYRAAKQDAVSNVTLTIKANSVVGFVGTTGSGKTTVVDLLLGLLTASSGEILVDGVLLGIPNVRAWQNSIGYIPQHIFLADDTIAANIALGVPSSDIDFAAVERAARTANLHHFIVSDLLHGYATEIGDRGVRLSGGQRQRLGIARALYHNPPVLVMDEATSAMDNTTEAAVMDAIHELGHSKTIVMVAHRLSTVKHCDCIFMFHEGKLLDSGRFAELLETSTAFRRLAGSAVP